MTTTLSDLAHNPELTRGDGTPIYVERCRASSANLAQCRNCGIIMGAGQFWGLTQRVWLHTSSGQGCAKVNYWRYL